MNNQWIHLPLAVACLALPAMALGCTTATQSATTDQIRGTLSLPLLTPRSAYRLRSAHFQVATQAGAPTATLDSDADPDAEALTITLTQGPYNVSLQGGWVLDRIADDGTETAVQAALTSPNPQQFQIQVSTQTNVSFTFATDAGTVVIGSAPLSITFNVGTPTNTPCSPQQSFSCNSGQTCLLADSSGQTFCASAGSLPVGSSCTSEQCVAGSQCLRLDSNHPDQGICTQFCDTNFVPFGCNCIGLGLPNSNTGICGAPPASACDLLAQTGCADGQACQFLGGGFGSCGTPGTTPPRGSCSGQTCMEGYQCFDGECLPFCDTRNGFTSDCFCENVNLGFVGLCF
jgi:hypothetical protein